MFYIIFNIFKSLISLEKKYQTENKNESDKLYRKQYFEETDTRNPTENFQQSCLLDNDLNSATLSLRQIMAEQQEEEIKENCIKKPQTLRQIRYDFKNNSVDFSNFKKKTNYLDQNPKDKYFDHASLIKNSNESRSLAFKYTNIKNDYLKKATEAHSKG